MEKLPIEGFKGLKLNCYLFLPSTKPKAVVQIIHGMQEHALRYKHFAEFLCKNGYVVLASDSRGHGKTAESIDKLGYSEGDIFTESVEDQLLITKYLKERFGLPVYIFGHSYGSFITQKLVQVNQDVKKFVICGSTDGDSILFKLGALLTGFLKLIGLKNKKAALVENMRVKSYGKKFENGNWLTRDDKGFDAYNNDPYCGGDFPVSFYHSIMTNLKQMNKGINDIPKDVHIMLIAGDNDPVGGNGNQVRSLFQKYINAGINAELEIYENCRHELINELNKEEIFNDILAFYKQR